MCEYSDAGSARPERLVFTWEGFKWEIPCFDPDADYGAGICDSPTDTRDPGPRRDACLAAAGEFPALGREILPRC